MNDRPDSGEERAARNQALFRAVNETIRALNDFATPSETFVIACECADATCIEMLSITTREYAAVRASPRTFAVLPGHVYPDVETVVVEHDSYVVVQKESSAADVAERLAFGT